MYIHAYIYIYICMWIPLAAEHYYVYIYIYMYTYMCAPLYVTVPANFVRGWTRQFVVYVVWCKW